MKKKWLIIGILLVSISWIGNYTFFAAKQPPHPLLLKHYYEIPIDVDRMSGTIDFRLSYLVNRNEEIDITGIQFPGADWIRMNSSHNVQIYNHYLLKTMYLSIDVPLLKEDKKMDEWLFKNVTVYLSNGQTKILPIGEIRIVKAKESELLEQMAGGGSSDQTGFNQWEANQPLKIKDVQISSTKPVDAWLKISVNGKPLTQDIFPVTLVKGKRVQLSYEWSFPEQDANGYHFYQVNAKILGEGENGQPFLRSMYVQYFPYFTNKEINDVAKQLRGEQQ